MPQIDGKSVKGTKENVDCENRNYGIAADFMCADGKSHPKAENRFAPKGTQCFGAVSGVLNVLKDGTAVKIMG